MYLSTSTSTDDFPEMYLSTLQVLYKLYLSTDVLKYKVLLPGSGIEAIWDEEIQAEVAWTCRMKGQSRLCECMEWTAPVGRPRKTWQNTVCADMRLLKVDPRDMHGRVKWLAIGRHTGNPSSIWKTVLTRRWI